MIRETLRQLIDRAYFKATGAGKDPREKLFEGIRIGEELVALLDVMDSHSGEVSEIFDAVQPLMERQITLMVECWIDGGLYDDNDDRTEPDS